MTRFSVSRYVTSFPAVCFVVLRTRKLLETQSETHDAERPRAADRSRNRRRSSSLDMTGSASFKALYVKNHGKCPAAVAAALAKDPWYSGPGPLSRTLFLSLSKPSAPSTCKVVFDVSTGISTILHNPAVIEPAAVLRGRGSCDVSGILSKSANTPIFAAVSPNLVSGPYRFLQQQFGTLK